MKHILPNDIELHNRVPMSTFGHYEDEASAYWIIMMCQQSNSWDAFSFEDIQKFYNASGKYTKPFSFNHLIEHGWIEYYDNLYHITYGFIHQLKEYYK